MARLSQSSIDRQQHIPPHIQQAMNQHMQGTMPAHLKRYMGEGAYVPSHAQRAINDHMQSSMPAHLKQYAGAYMEQQVLNPNAAPGTATPPQPQAPVPDRMRLDHSNVAAAQYDAKFNTGLFAPDAQAAPTAPPQQPQAQVQPQSVDPNSPDYGFIVQPPKPPKRGLSLPGFSGGNPLVVRIIVVLGGLLVLLVVFAVIKGLLSGGGNTQALVTVAQDQQEMIHILTNSAGQGGSQQQAVLSASNQNFAATAKLSLTSAQTQLITYMKTNGKKVSTKTLGLKISPATDQQLTTAASNSTYDTTFKQVMQTKLTDYETALGAAYKETKGPKGRKLLINEYNGAKLLLTQLNSPAS
jgi:hypothetical protein